MLAENGSIALKRRGAIQVDIGSKSIVGSNVLEDRSGTGEELMSILRSNYGLLIAVQRGQLFN